MSSQAVEREVAEMFAVECRHNREILITPEMADALLLRNAKNRDEKPSAIAVYAEDIRNGNWVSCHQGIAFDTDGVLVDGQNRLRAISLAQTPTPVRVFFNELPESRRVVDRNSPRTNIDNANLCGRDLGTTKTLAVLRAMIAGRACVTKPASVAVELKQYAEHRKAIEFAHEMLRRGIKGVALAPIKAVIARAWYYVPPETLRQFCDILTTGLSSDPSSAGVSLLFRVLIGISGAKVSANRLRYNKTAWALGKFTNGESPSFVRAAAEEMYPLPGGD